MSRDVATLEARHLWQAGALTGALVMLVAGLALALPEPPLVRSGRAVSFILLSLPPLLLAMPAWLRQARRWADHPASRWWLVVILLLALLPDRLVRGTLSDLVGPGLYALAALLVTADRPRQAAARPRDLLVVALLWLPLELRWFDGDTVLTRFFGLNLLLLLYVIERPVWEPGRLLPGRVRELVWGAGAYAVFLVPAIPIAMATGFAWPGLSQRSAGEWVLFLVATFWIIAFPEEALFRGVIQSQLTKVMGVAAGLLLASFLFGLSHLNNGNPDWRYVLLATVAGIAYGTAYLKTGTIAAPTLTHFLVDITWRGFFAGPNG